MQYTDEKTGEVLYGYSQTDIDKLTRVLWVFALLLTVIVMMAGFVLWYIIEHRVVSNIAMMCLRGG